MNTPQRVVVTPGIVQSVPVEVGSEPFQGLVDDQAEAKKAGGLFDADDNDIFGDPSVSSIPEDPEDDVFGSGDTTDSEDQDEVDDAASTDQFEDSEGDEDGSEDGEDEPGLLTIFKHECLNCISLYANGTKQYKKCHFTEGNEDCPASQVKIVVGIPVGRLIKRILDAEELGEAESLTEVYAKISTKDPDVQALFFQELSVARRKREEQ